MARISLKETYDNRSVIAQIAKVTDTAEDAAETVQEKAAEINDALTDVNAAVQAAEGAVTTANAASASAQQSAQTVAGYNTRLTTAEGEIDTLQTDLNSVTLRVQTAEGQIVTIQGRVTALETADGQNVKLTGEHAIGNYAVLLTGNQGPILGVKDFEFSPKCKYGGSQGAGEGWFKLWESEASVQSLRRTTILNIVYREQSMYAKLILSRRNLNQTVATLITGNTSANSIIVTRDNEGKMTVWTSTTRTSAWIECETLGSYVAEVAFSQVLNDDTLYTEPQASDYAYLVRI